jgi:hypothetical protein
MRAQAASAPPPARAACAWAAWACARIAAACVRVYCRVSTSEGAGSSASERHFFIHCTARPGSLAREHHDSGRQSIPVAKQAEDTGSVCDCPGRPMSDRDRGHEPRRSRWGRGGDRFRGPHCLPFGHAATVGPLAHAHSITLRMVIGAGAVLAIYIARGSLSGARAAVCCTQRGSVPVHSQRRQSLACRSSAACTSPLARCYLRARSCHPASSYLSSAAQGGQC